MIQVAECHSAADVRALLRRYRPAPVTPIVNIPSAQELIHRTPRLVDKRLIVRVTLANPDIREILIAVCKEHGVSFSGLRGKKRAYKFTTARQDAYYRLRIALKLSLPQIGKLIGRRDHSTIHHGIIAHCRRRYLPVPTGGMA